MSTTDGSPSLWQVVGSVASAFFGVQSSRNRERDFKRGKPWQFIAIAFAGTGVVALIFYTAVQVALHFARH
ncbi:MAG TPA: DUF2970 domain-containing protein [Nevskiaceae bacterium]|nr:DUF2970 domain-containing protein [Nevskiaceae bacterium]